MVCDIADSIGYWVTVAGDITQAHNYLKTLDEIDCEYLQNIAKKYLKSSMVSTSLLLAKGEN